MTTEDGWDAARDRATEANQARRDERERIAVLAEKLNALWLDHKREDAGDRDPWRDFSYRIRNPGEFGDE